MYDSFTLPFIYNVMIMGGGVRGGVRTIFFFITLHGSIIGQELITLIYELRQQHLTLIMLPKMARKSLSLALMRGLVVYYAWGLPSQFLALIHPMQLMVHPNKPHPILP